jgi:hypothetical protein
MVYALHRIKTKKWKILPKQKVTGHFVQTRVTNNTETTFKYHENTSQQIQLVCTNTIIHEFR